MTNKEMVSAFLKVLGIFEDKNIHIVDWTINTVSKKISTEVEIKYADGKREWLNIDTAIDKLAKEMD
jgi:hypothetical protein